MITPEELAEAFAHGWALPKPDAFLDYFLPRIAPDAVFTQPMFPLAIGHQQISHMFQQLFALMPDLAAVPRHSAVAGETVFIESDCTVTFAGTPTRFRVCDRFELHGGLISERRSYFDPLPLLAAFLRHPSRWPEMLKLRR